MIYQCLTGPQLHPKLPLSKTPVSLTVYARPHTGELLADDGARWGVLILPGGGYTLTAPGEAEPVALSFLAAGVQAFVLHYSVAPNRWPQAFLEAAAALSWIRDHAEQFGLSPHRVAVCGFSAGGHLAGCLSNLWHLPLAGDALGLTPAQIRPDRTILCYPVISQALDPKSGSLERLCGGPVPPMLNLDQSVTPQTPPTFLWSTWSDASVPVSNTLHYAGALLGAGVPCELHIYGWGPHAMGVATPESARDPAHHSPHAASWLELCLEWLRRDNL